MQLSLSPYLFVRPTGEGHRHADKGESVGLHSVKNKTKPTALPEKCP